jgi:hypothetical protein
MTGFLLGVDYGTSNTVAVLRLPDGRSQPLLHDGSPLLPSAVYAPAEGGLITGRDAQRSAALDPARYEPNPKRRVDDGEVLLGDRSWPVAELVAATLRRVAAEAGRLTGGVAPRVVITCPVRWGPTRRAVLTEAARLIGLPAPALVPEPVAAATYFATVLGRQVPPGRGLVVYDLGGGTFDACVVRRTPTGFETLAAEGLDDFGGVDLDALVVRQVLASVAPVAADAARRLAAPADQADRRAYRLLLEDARAAKETLSRQPQATLFVPVAERDTRITRYEFEPLARPAVDRTVQVTMAAVTRSRLTPAELAGIFLVGGSSRVPLVADAIRQATGLPPVTLDQPELVVAQGALHTADLTAGPAPVPVPGLASIPASGPGPLPGPGPAPAPPVGGPPGQRPPYGPAAGRPAARPKKSRTKLVVGLLAGVVALMLVGVAVVGALARGNTGHRQQTADLYKQLGKPTGFSERSGDPKFLHATQIEAVLTDTRDDGSDPVRATTDWMSKLSGNVAPDKSTVESYFSGGSPKTWYPQGFSPHSVEVKLSTSGDTYRIDVGIIY